MVDWSSIFADALPYQSFIERHATPPQRLRWATMHGRFSLSAEQRESLGGFVRCMPVLCLAGAWCGDCINQCPIYEHFAHAAPMIQVRYLDRDEHSDVQRELKINGGDRVPVVVFFSEDGYEAARFGERTLSKYRQMMSQLTGAACPAQAFEDGSETL